MQRETNAIVAIEECAKVLVGQQRCRSQGKADAPNEQQAQDNSAIKIKTKISLIYMQNASALLAAAVKLLCALLAAVVKLLSALLVAVKPCC